MLAKRYKAITAVHPSAMASGRLRLGFRASPAINVTSCHESAEKSEPDCATHNATTSPYTLPAATPSDGSKLPKVNMPVKFALTAAEFQPRNSPARMSAA